MLHTPFARSASLLVLGRAHGDFSPRLEGTRARVLDHARALGADHVTAMQVGFRHDICAEHSPPESHDGLCWSRASRVADGVLVARPGHAVFLANADCPVGLMYHADRGLMCVLHLGFGCLWQYGLEGPTLLERAFDALGPGRIQMFVAGGIGPCCYGVRTQTPAEVARDRYLQGLLGTSTIASRGPRRGQPSLDLYAIICAQARRAEISIDATCTSCHGGPGDDAVGTFHSNTRDRARTGSRNLVLAMLNPTGS